MRDSTLFWWVPASAGLAGFKRHIHTALTQAQMRLSQVQLVLTQVYSVPSQVYSGLSQVYFVS